MGSITRSLEEAISKAAALPPEDQDALAAFIQAEIDDNEIWEERFNDPRSPKLLERLAAEALAEDEARVTEPLDALLGEVERDTADPPHTAR